MDRAEITITTVVVIIIAGILAAILISFIVGDHGSIRSGLRSVGDIHFCPGGRCWDICPSSWEKAAISGGCGESQYCCYLKDVDEYYPEGTTLLQVDSPKHGTGEFRFPAPPDTGETPFTESSLETGAEALEEYREHGIPRNVSFLLKHRPKRINTDGRLRKPVKCAVQFSIGNSYSLKWPEKEELAEHWVNCNLDDDWSDDYGFATLASTSLNDILREIVEERDGDEYSSSVIQSAKGVVAQVYYYEDKDSSKQGPGYILRFSEEAERS